MKKWMGIKQNFPKIHGLQNSLGLNLLNLSMTTFLEYIAKSISHGKTIFPGVRWLKKHNKTNMCKVVRSNKVIG
jgi:hypothetical protein